MLLVRSRRSPLRLLTHNQPSAQQANEISAESNDRFGIINGQCTFAENFDADHPKKIIQPLISSQRIITFAEITAEKCDFLHFSALKSVISPNYKPNQRHAH